MSILTGSDSSDFVRSRSMTHMQVKTAWLKSSSHPVSGILVKPAGIADQLKPAADVCSSVREIVFDPSELGLHVLLLILGLTSARD